MRLNKEALELLTKSQAEGLVLDSEQDIIDIVRNQEVVTYCSENGSVTFDIYDVEFDDETDY